MNSENSFKQFRDFVYLENEIHVSGIRMIVNLKIFEDYRKNKYLGSIRIGIFHDYNNKNLKEFIKDILEFNYPTYQCYELDVIKN